MKTICALLALVALTSLGVEARMVRIVGGSYTSDGDYPEMVSVYEDPLLGKRDHLCGGIIINDNHVLTTATCVDGLGTLYLHVMGAGSNLDAPEGYEEFKNVNEIFIHEGYEPTAKVNDLAVLRLSHNFVFVNGLITPAVLPLPDTPEPANGTVLTAVGWGKDSADGTIQTQQKAVNMTYLPQDICQEVFGLFVQPNEGCLRGYGQVGVCEVDEEESLPGSGDDEPVSVPSFTPSPTPSPIPTTSGIASPSPTPSTSSRVPSKKRKQVDYIDKAMALALVKLSSIPSHVDPDPCLDVSRLVFSELKNMDEQQRKIAKKLICEVLSLGDMGRLTFDHQIVKAVGSDQFHA